ncbi:MAG: biotin--[acetyl-CoA-carboxylase] ligase [Betaproteobacteria bacterium]|nr:biotin--[acetyl-CoA-carboxylase] ligase [Betaproteobacteria bacterium]NDE30377.1 biotin--[acetyl-CoA-carboxylase] ligase [Betaproteobacteria bacterium]
MHLAQQSSFVQAIIESMSNPDAFAASQDLSRSSVPNPNRAELEDFDIAVDWEASLDSTNVRLLAAPWPRAEAFQGQQPLVRCLVADHQSAGRGRAGKVWHDEPGASLLMSVSIDRNTQPWPSDLSAFSLVTAVCVAERLESTGPVDGRRLWLKWPNDVVRFQATDEGLAKLVGILIEARQHAGQSRLVIGLGINLLPPRNDVSGPKSLPADGLFSRTLQSVQTLDRAWRLAIAKQLSHDLLGAWIDFEAMGLALFAHRIRSRDALFGRPLLIHDEKQHHGLEALGQGLDERGRLLVLCQRAATEAPCIVAISEGSVRLRHQHKA